MERHTTCKEASTNTEPCKVTETVSSSKPASTNNDRPERTQPQRTLSEVIAVVPKRFKRNFSSGSQQEHQTPSGLHQSPVAHPGPAQSLNKSYPFFTDETFGKRSDLGSKRQPETPARPPQSSTQPPEKADMFATYGPAKSRLASGSMQETENPYGFCSKKEAENPYGLGRLPKNYLEPLRPLEEANILATYGPANKRLFLFDFDGTLAEIVSAPERARLPATLYGWLQKLALEPKNTVWVISGRDQMFLEFRLGTLTGVGLVAEHGAFVRRPGCDLWDDLGIRTDMRWWPIVRSEFQSFVDNTPMASVEEKKKAIVLHYRLSILGGFEAMQVASCKESLEKKLHGLPVKFVNGRCILEARPSNVDKGQIVKRIIDEASKQDGGPPDFILCIGDDVTDEDMFRSLHNSELSDVSVAVTIGNKAKLSEAYYYLEGPTEVFATIKMLNDCDDAGDVEGFGPLESNGRYRGSKTFPVPRSCLVD